MESQTPFLDELLVGCLGRDSDLMASRLESQPEGDVGLHFAPRATRGDGYPQRPGSPVRRYLRTGWSGGEVTSRL
jgi:hypothetical protein